MIEEIMGNVVDEYFRGSSSYEDAVTNRLNVLEATGIATTVAVANMKSDLSDAINTTTSEVQGLRSDFQAVAVGLYNQGQSIRNDIQNMTMGVTSAIQESTYALVASQSMLAENFKQGFNAVNNTLDFGFSLVGNKIDVFSDKICSKLDEIHDILNNPRLTESRELYREALRSYQKGYFEEALEDCKGAVEKNKTDFISWYLLGMIYLFGAGKFSNVIDLDKAEEALANAAKYIDSDIGQSEEANLFASEIYYYLGLTKLIKSNDYLLENRIDDSNSKLLEAEKASNTAYKLSDENLLAKYEHAKELHFLGKDDESLQLLEDLIKEEKNFAIKATNDKNLESLWGEIECLILKLREELVYAISKKIAEFESVAINRFNELKQQAEEIKLWTEEENLTFEKFYNSEMKIGDVLFARDHKKMKDFDNLAKKVGIRDLGLKEEDFSAEYGRLYFGVCTFSPTTLQAEKATLNDLKKAIDSKIETIQNLSASYKSALKSDYFSVLKKYDEMDNELDFPGPGNKFLFGDKGSGVAFIPGRISILQDHEKVMQVYLLTQKEWEKSSEEKRQKYEEERQRELKLEKRGKRIGFILGIIISIIVYSICIFFLERFGQESDLFIFTFLIVAIVSGILFKKLIYELTYLDGCFTGILLFIAGVALFLLPFIIGSITESTIWYLFVAAIMGGVFGFLCSEI